MKDLEEYIAINKNKIASNYHSESSKHTKPNKFITKQANKLQKEVVKDSGISATIVAVPKYKNAKKSTDF